MAGEGMSKHAARRSQELKTAIVEHSKTHSGKETCAEFGITQSCLSALRRKFGVKKSSKAKEYAAAYQDRINGMGIVKAARKHGIGTTAFYEYCKNGGQHKQAMPAKFSCSAHARVNPALMMWVA